MRDESRPPSPDRFGSFVVWFAIIFCFKWQSLSEPPFWDSVVGLFPAAAVLADTGFDLRSLLQQPTGSFGGPNTHSESIVTWLVAVLLWLFGKGWHTLVLLHVLNFATAAWTLSKLFQLAARELDRTVAWMLCASVLACPLFHVQVGAIYLEIPMALCTVSAVAAYSSGQLRRALLWGALATCVKQSGIIVLGALSVAVLFGSGPWLRRSLKAAAFAMVGLLLVAVPLLESPLLGDLSGYSGTKWNGLWDWAQKRPLFHLKTIPDVFGISLIFAVEGLIKLHRILAAFRASPGNEHCSAADPLNPPVNVSSSLVPRAVGLAWVLLWLHYVFFFVVPFVTKLFVLALPRYTVSIFPCVLFGVVYGLSARLSPRAVNVVLGGLILFFVANRTGDFYSLHREHDLSIHERSGAYRQLVNLQQATMQTASRLPDDATIYYGLLEHFMMQHPWMGYAERKHPGGRCVAVSMEQPKSTNRDDLPSHFFVILDRRGFWGERFLNALLQDADADSTRKVLLYRRFQQGQFAIDIYEVRPATE